MSNQPLPAEAVQEILDRLQNLNSRLEVFEKQGNPNPYNLNINDFIPDAFKAPGELSGILVDEGIARDTPCRALVFGTERRVYSPGIVGALSDKEQILYCASGTENIELSPEMAARQKVLEEAKTICQKEVSGLPIGERLAPFLKCLTGQADRHGVKI